MNRKTIFALFLVLVTILSFVNCSGIFNITAGEAQGTYLSIEPSELNVRLGDYFVVSVNVYNVKDLNKWELSLNWDAGIIDLELGGTAIEEGSCLKSVGVTKFEVSAYESGSGVLSKVSCYLIQAKGFSGNGTLFTIRFKAISPGKSFINISFSKLQDFMFRNIFHTSKSSQVSVTSVLRNISIMSFSSPDVALLGRSYYLNISIKNNGAIRENVIVEFYVNGSLLNSKNLDIDVNAVVSISFLWSPHTIGAYNVTVFVPPVTGEIDVNDNKAFCIVTVQSHDLAISLECPTQVLVNSSVTLNITVANLGSFKEENLRSYIVIDGVENALPIIDFLSVGEKRTLQYSWTPVSVGLTNVTVYVEPCYEEFGIANNRDTKEISVIMRETPKTKLVLLVADDDGSWHEYGTSLLEWEEALSTLEYGYDVWKESEKGRPSLQTLLNYDVVIWTVGDFCNYAIDKVDAITLREYISNKGNLIIEGQFIALENYNTILLSQVLHVEWKRSFITSSPSKGMVTISGNPITKGLPTKIEWVIQNNGHDVVLPASGAYPVANFSEINSTAINVFDGCQTGEGSVVYFSFSFKWLPQSSRNYLVQNIIEWFRRKDLSTVASRVKFSPEKQVYFIYGSVFNPYLGSCIPQGILIHTLCVNYQNELTDSDGILLIRILNNTTFVLLGNPCYNKVVEYYEKVLKLTPVRCENTSEKVIFYDSQGNILYSLHTADLLSGYKDAFVIYVFEDAFCGNTYLVIYGLGFKGSWAAEIYYSQVILCNLPKYLGQYFIFSWTDINGDAVPQIEEIKEESFG